MGYCYLTGSLFLFLKRLGGSSNEKFLYGADAFVIRDSFEVAKGLGLAIPRSNLCGGGANSPLWRKIMANVLNIPLNLLQTEQGPGYGGAMLAMVACGVCDSVCSAVDALVRVSSTVESDHSLAGRYEARYQQFKEIYPSVKSLFPKLMGEEYTV